MCWQSERGLVTGWLGRLRSLTRVLGRPPLVWVPGGGASRSCVYSSQRTCEQQGQAADWGHAEGGVCCGKGRSHPAVSTPPLLPSPPHINVAAQIDRPAYAGAPQQAGRLLLLNLTDAPLQLVVHCGEGWRFCTGSVRGVVPGAGLLQYAAA